MSTIPTTEPVSLRIPSEDLRWLERLAARNGIRVSSMLRALLHGLRVAAEQGELESLDMGRLVLRG